MSIASTLRRGLAPSALALAAALAAAPGLSAQGHLVSLGGEINHGSLSVEPRYGTVGTEFKIVPHNLPPNTDVQVMLGALRAGFEVVKTLRTDDRGLLSGRDTITITVPDWVTNDRAYLVMLTDTNYNPLAQADMFHPTKADGMIVRRGLVKLDPTGCRFLTAEGGEQYALEGDTSMLMLGKEMLVKGKVVPAGQCGPFTTIELRAAKLPPF